MTAISSLFEKIVSILSTYSLVSDTLDLLLLTFLFYYILKMIRDSRALTFAKGFVIFVAVYALVLLFNMQASAILFKAVFNNILIILVVIFAPELRKLLENMGTSTKAFATIKGLFKSTASQRAILYNNKVTDAVNEICRAASDMSDKKIGALIVFEKATPLGEICKTGTVIDAEISSELIGNIFYPKSPLHDGAAVIRDAKLYSAGCILPLTSKNNISSELGTRHRAALGMSEQSDALVLVVSEETGDISIAYQGKLVRNVSDGDARELLLNFLKVPEGGEKHGK